MKPDRNVPIAARRNSCRWLSRTQEIRATRLIDNSLLAQRGKDMGVSVEADVVKQLDQIRIQNNLADMDDLEKAVTAQGINWDDFKNNIRNRALTQLVIGREVGSHITISQKTAKNITNSTNPSLSALNRLHCAPSNSRPKARPAEVADIKKKAEDMRKS